MTSDTSLSGVESARVNRFKFKRVKSMFKRSYFPVQVIFIAVVAAVLFGCSERGEQPGETADAADPADADAALVAADGSNPFFTEWDTPFGIPPFGEIRDEHYKPAYERAIEELRADIDAIRNNPEHPTFENTLEALELAGPLLDRVHGVFGNITCLGLVGPKEER